MKIPGIFKKRNRRSIRRRLVLLVTGMHGILMVSVTTDVVQRQQTFLIGKAHAQIMRQAELLAASTAPQLITNDLAGLDDVLSSVRHDAAVQWVAVTDHKGLVKGDSDHSRQGKYYVDETSLAVLGGKTSRMIRESDCMLSAAAPIMVEGQILGWAWISRDLSAENAQIIQLRQTGYRYAMFAIILGAVLAAILASQITRQLRLLLAGTKRLAEDRFDMPVPIVTDNDVGAVAHAFNNALRRLERARLQIMQTQAELEAEVRERRAAEARLQDVNRALVSANESLMEFAHAASHDLQEPLRSVTGYSELLRRRYAGKLDDDAEEFINYVYDSAQRMQLMIRALLAYARAGSEAEALVDVDCGQALAMALENLEIAIQDTAAKVHAAGLPHVSAHEVAVVQLFQNLIGNAIKYAGPRPPEIWITADRSDRFWTVSVRDNGAGIPPGQHKKIFGIFKRAHGKQYAGAGVGLAICAKIVERYGGSIFAVSEVDQGAEFRFTLPEVPTECAVDWHALESNRATRPDSVAQSGSAELRRISRAPAKGCASPRWREMMPQNHLWTTPGQMNSARQTA